MTQSLTFEQKDGETVRESVGRLCKYIIRCPAKETPNQERLFFKVLQDRNFYIHAPLCQKLHRH